MEKVIKFAMIIGSDPITTLGLLGRQNIDNQIIMQTTLTNFLVWIIMS